MNLIGLNTHKNLKRYRQIVLTFVKHGFGTLLDNIGILKYLGIRSHIASSDSESHKRYSAGERLRMALEELGPTFIKLGQVLSTRSDILPKDIVSELEKLQDNVPAFNFEQVKDIVEAEFNKKLDSIFYEFSETPIAAASIAQVHLARIGSGQRVVVKVRRPHIDEIVDLDLKILHDIAKFIENNTKYGELYDFVEMVGEFEKTLKNELDFRNEAENAEAFRKMFSNDKNVSVPEIIWTHTTQKVLTMEYINGVKLNEISKLEQINANRSEIAVRLARSIFNQILKDGFFHADPHPGNIMVLEENKIVFLDLGMVGRLSERRKIQFLKILIGIVYKNSKLVVEGIADLDALSKPLNTRKLERDIDKLRDKYIDLPFEKLKIGDMFSEIFSLAFKYKIKLPVEFTMISKTLVTLEGIVEKLDPGLSVIEIAEPIAKSLMYRIFSIREAGEDIYSGALDYSRLISDFPLFAVNFLKKIENDDYSINFRISNIQNVLKSLERVSNKIAFSIILLSLSVIIAGITIGSGMSAHVGREVYLLNVNIMKIALIIAAIIIAGLVFSIIKYRKF